MSKNQKIIILIGAPLLVVMILVYALVIAPLLKVDKPETEPPQLLPGEVLGASNRILMFEHVERAAMKSIEVHNDKGSYTFYLADDGQFYIKGMEGAPYNLELFASLVVSAGNTLTLSRITTDCENLSDYGLSEADQPAWYVITKTDGTTHKVYIGDRTVSHSGFYVRYEGRNAVYILDSTIESTLLAGVYSLVTPVLALPLTQETYYTADDFFMLRDNQLIVSIDYVPEQENPTEGGLGEWKMQKPAPYVVNSSSYSTVLETLTQFYGSETVEFGSAFTDQFFKDHYEDGEGGDAEFSEDVEKYYAHLKDTYAIDVKAPDYLISYRSGDVTSYVIFSKPDLSGNMYAYSSLYDLVAKINIATVPFLEWDVIQFIDRPIFTQMIGTVSKIEVESEELNCTFFLEGDDKDIKVTTNLSSTPFGSAMYRSFQEWYREFVSIQIQDKTGSDAKENLYATVTVTNDAGEVTVYRFYPYSTRRCFVTINDSGEFYVMLEQVERLIADAGRLMRGETVDADAIY